MNENNDNYSVIEYVSQKLFEKKQMEIQNHIRMELIGNKLNIGTENKELIDSTISWDTFVKSGPIVKDNDDVFLMLVKDGDPIRITKEQPELYNVFNNIYNQTNSDTVELRSMIVKNYDEVKKQFEDETEELYDTFYDYLNSGFINLDGPNKLIAEAIISNIHTLTQEDGKFKITCVPSSSAMKNMSEDQFNSIKEEAKEDVEYVTYSGFKDQDGKEYSKNGLDLTISENGNLKDFYIPLVAVNTFLATSNLTLNEMNMDKKDPIYENPEQLKDQEITDEGAKKIKVNGADIEHLDKEDTEIIKLLKEYELEDSVPEIDDKYASKYLEIIEKAKEDKISPSELSKKLWELKYATKISGDWSIGKGLKHLKNSTIDKTKYRLTYISDRLKDRTNDFLVITGIKSLKRRVVRFIDKKRGVEPEDKNQKENVDNLNTPIITLNKENEKPEKDNPSVVEKNDEQPIIDESKDENLVEEQNDKEEPLVEVKEPEEKTNDIKKETEVKEEPKVTKVSLEKQSIEDKYQSLLDNVCNQIDGNVKNGENLEDELAKYGLSKKEYDLHKTRKSIKRYRDLKNQKYIDSFKAELESSRKAERDEMINQARQEILKDMNKMDEIYDEFYKEQTTLSTDKIFNNYYDELQAAMNVEEESKGKSR